MTKPGRAVERNALSWHRTVLSLMAVATLLLKLALTRHRPVELCAAILAYAETGVILLGQRRRRYLPDAARPAVLLLTAAMTAGLTTLVALSLWGPIT